MIALLVSLVSLGWLGWGWIFYKRVGKLELLLDLVGPPPLDWPRLSVIVPARNEAQGIGAALESLLAADYPDLEVIVVNDRSTDETAEIIRKAQVGDDRLKLVEVEELPQGWMGKVNALNQGTQLATGEWILFTDADVQFSGDCFKKAISHVTLSRLDHLTLLVGLEFKNPWLPIFYAGGLALMGLSVQMDKVSDPRSRAYFGVGAFQLVRKSLWEKTPGWEWLKMEMAEDMGAALMLKTHGARSEILGGRGVSLVNWYPSVRALFSGGGVRSIAIARYRHKILAIQIMGLLLVSVVPFFGFYVGGLAHALFQVSWFATGFIISRESNRLFGIPKVYGFLFPFALMLTVGFMIYSFWTTLKSGTMPWRGRTYSLNELRKGQRVKI